MTEETKYKLQGALIKREDGSLEKTKMFDILEIPLDDYSDIELTESELRRLRMHIMKIKTGIQAMAPLLCPGPVKCVFSERCPLVDKSICYSDGKVDFVHQNIKIFPIARQCLLERELLDFQRRRYIEEYDIDVESPTEMGMINKLAELDVYDMRTSIILSQFDDNNEGGNLLKSQTTNITMTGDVIKRLEIHPAFELKEKIHKQREEILKSMVGTRREKYKQAAALKKPEFSDPSSTVAALREQIIRLEKETAIDAEYTEEKPVDA